MFLPYLIYIINITSNITANLYIKKPKAYGNNTQSFVEINTLEKYVIINNRKGGDANGNNINFFDIFEPIRSVCVCNINKYKIPNKPPNKNDFPSVISP